MRSKIAFSNPEEKIGVRMRPWMAMVGIVALAGTAMAQGADVIAQRRAGLKRMGEHMQAMKAVADSRGDPRPAAQRVDDMISWFRSMPSHFPNGSDQGDTRALPAIWSDNTGFVQANTNALNSLRHLREAAASGDQARFAQAYQDTGPTCGTCHRSFRSNLR
jgi:cytochrome c556